MDSLSVEPPGKPKNTGEGSLSLLQGNFPIQELNLGLRHCRRLLYQLSHHVSPRILEWVAYPFFSGSSPPRNGTGVSSLTGRSLPTKLSEKPSRTKKRKKLVCDHEEKLGDKRKLHRLHLLSESRAEVTWLKDETDLGLALIILEIGISNEETRKI